VAPEFPCFKLGLKTTSNFVGPLMELALTRIPPDSVNFADLQVLTTENTNDVP
jgi:hypothetical protein